MKLRRLALRLHGSIGIIAGILLVVIGLTGSLLVFSHEIDHLVHPQLLQVVSQAEQISPQRVVDIAQAFQPSLKPHRITMPRSPNETYTVMMISPNDEYTDVYVNSYDGAVLGSRPWKQTVVGWLIDLHVHLFAGDWGMNLVGICGGGFLVMGITGLLLWNGWKQLRFGFKIRWQAPWQLVNYDLHKALGVASVALLCLIALTGMAMVFWTPFETAVYSLTKSPKPPEFVSKMIPGTTPMDINQLLRKAEATLPEGKIFKFFPAKTPDATFNVWMEVLHEHEFNKNPYLRLDQYSGEVLHVSGWKNDSLGDRLLSAPYILHVGNYGGWLTRILYCLIGLVPLVLLITGFVLWNRRRWLSAHRKDAIQHSQRITAKP
ncbi:MAG: PepSY domain-containing protein [Oscillatoriales cyanobacterium C42_A2020_001]|nr:PepSY domain-containing protein [Leptolyngbyaceae cyanobacterium C42_A2020_001]